MTILAQTAETIAGPIAQWAGDQGIGIACLLFGLYWLNNQNKRQAAEVKAALDATTAERGARLNIMEQQVITLNDRVNACEKDRQSLWVQIVELTKRAACNATNIENLSPHPQPKNL